MIYIRVCSVDHQEQVRLALSGSLEQQRELKALGGACNPMLSVGGLFDMVGRAVETKPRQGGYGIVYDNPSG